MRKVKNYDELTFDDGFMFGKIMNNYPDICKDVLHVITGQEPGELIRNEREFDVKITAESKGVRYDVYVEDSDSMYDAEMQKEGGEESKSLPKRSRYYQSVMDINNLEAGEDYTNLKQCFIIFICKFDPFKEGRMVYTFKNICIEDTSLELGDDVTKIFINTKAPADDTDEGLAELAEYINNNRITGKLSDRIHQAVVHARNVPEWRTEYMNMSLHDRDVRMEGREEGREEGRQEIALNMLRLGTIEIEDISKCTGLTISELLELKLRL